MECTGNNICLLFRGKLYKVYCISGNADCKLRIILRMLLSIKQCVPVKYIHVKVVSTLCCISIQ